jgi:hypothetical protein
MLNRKPVNNIVSIEFGRKPQTDPDPSPTSARKRKPIKSENQFSRRRFFQLTLGVLDWTIDAASRETGHPRHEGEYDIKELARREFDRQNRKAA